MEDSSRPTRPARPGFRRLLDEDAQAMVEFVVLLPVYLFLIVAMIYTGHLMLIRQQVVEAARWYAWADVRSGRLELGPTFLPRFADGGRTASAGVQVSRTPLRFPADALNKAGGTRETRQVALAFLNNEGQGQGTNLQRRESLVQCSYRFSWFGERWGIRVLTQRARHTMYGYRDPTVRRRVFQPRRQHPVELITSNSPGAGIEPYVPSQNQYLPLLLFRRSQNSFNLQWDPGTNHQNHPCLWNTRHQLGNTSTANPFFYHYDQQR